VEKQMPLASKSDHATLQQAEQVGLKADRCVWLRRKGHIFLDTLHQYI